MANPHADRRKEQSLREFRRRVRQAIDDHGMVAAGEAVLIGVSGGPDSVALLDVLHSLAAGLKIHLGIAHLDHNLRGAEGRADADFVARTAAQYRLPFYGHRVDSGDYRALRGRSVEEAARILRYRFLEATARRHGYERIAVGHNADDNAETVLLFLLRGSGPGGLAGIRPQAGPHIRPLIRLKRLEINRYLDLCDLPFVSDRSNIDLRFVRNRIRHRLLPLLQSEFNPAIVESLNRLARIFQDEETWLQTITRDRIDAVIERRDRHRIRLSATGLRAMPGALQRRVLRTAIAELKGDLRRVGFTHIESVRALLEKPEAEASLDLPGKIRLRLENGSLTISHGGRESSARRRPTGVPRSPRYEYRIDSPVDLPRTLEIEPAGQRIRFSAIGPAAGSKRLNAGQNVAFFDMDKLVFPLVLRGVRAGDRFSPSGVDGTQKVKKFFIDHKVPKAERAVCPVLVSAGRIVWLVGHRIDADFAPDAFTRSVLKVQLSLV